VRNRISVKTVVAFIAFAAALVPCAALANAHVELSDTATAIESHNGTLVAAPIGGITKPGERLRYTIVAKNTGDRPAANLAPVAKIPAGERFVAGTAGATAEYSVDGGKTWSREPMVQVTNPGGTNTTRRALPAEFNAIRWLDPLLLAPGARVIFTYDIIVE
jgi:uncharacterized repeat protein (TIGR01451 family)